MLTFDQLQVTFQVRGDPRGKGAVGERIVTPHGKRAFIAHYTDSDTAAFMEAVGWRAREAMRGRAPLVGPLALIVTAVIAVPKSWSKKDTAAALAHDIRPDVKPDFDNIAKMVDGMKGIVWVDDKQVVDGRQLKWYGALPYVQFEVFQ